MFMVKMDVNIASLTRWAKRNGLFVQNVEDDLGYGLHAILINLFGESAPRPFFLQKDRSGYSLLGYTMANKTDMLDYVSAFADPDACAAIDIENIGHKKMPSSFKSGAYFGFSVRCRTTIRNHNENGKYVEKDAYTLDASLSKFGNYASWLEGRLKKAGCGLRDVKITRALNTISLRRDENRKLVPVSGPDISFSGTLFIENDALAATGLYNPIGRHGAFGYGMVLLSPAKAL